jgi:DNA-binding IclR family transcriptional regulator
MSQSLERALRLLIELGTDTATLDELADAVGVHKTTVLRLLRTLEKQRFVSRVDSRHYRLGSALFDLANQALEGRDVRQAAQPALAELNRDTGHTVHLASFEDDVVVYIDKFDSRHPVRMYSRIGRTAPLHCTAVAKILLAELPNGRQREIAESLAYERKTANTITSPERFMAELRMVAEQGYAVDHGEHEDLVNCIGAPIRGSDGKVAAAVSVTVPTMLADYEEVLTLLPQVRKAAAAASIACGWSAPESE